MSGVHVKQDEARAILDAQPVGAFVIFQNGPRWEQYMPGWWRNWSDAFGDYDYMQSRFIADAMAFEHTVWVVM